jgi:long-chain acyl-CoA synthetase
MVHNLRVQQFLEAEVQRINDTQLSPVERARAHHLVVEPWTVENGYLTATLKMRRGAISQKYAPEIDRLFTTPL